jgi:hypothetical protein
MAHKTFQRPAEIWEMRDAMLQSEGGSCRSWMRRDFQQQADAAKLRKFRPSRFFQRKLWSARRKVRRKEDWLPFFLDFAGRSGSLQVLRTVFPIRPVAVRCDPLDRRSKRPL